MDLDLHSFWDRLLFNLEDHIGHQNVEIWLKPAFPIEFDGQRLVLEVNNRYYADWIRENYKSALETEGAAQLGSPVTLEFTYKDDPTTEAPREASSRAMVRTILLPSST